MTTTRGALCTLLLASSAAWAYPNGISGRSELGCSQCHLGSNTGNRPTVTLTGPSTINAGTTQTFSVTVSGGPGVLAGFDVSVDGGTLQTKGSGEIIKDGDVTHDYAGTMDGGTMTWAFSVTAGSGGSVALFASGLSSNGQGVIEDGGDRDNQAAFVVPINGGHAPPTVAQAATAAVNPVITTAVALTALGADTSQPANTLVYTWSATSTGSGTVSFSPNASTTALDTTATFTAAGTYALTVTISNAINETVTSTVTVDVAQTATTLGMTPNAPSVAAGNTLSFNMAAMDQFGGAMTTTGITWTASGDGTINSSGVFTAGAQAGTATVVATLGSLAASTTVTVTGTGTTTGNGPMVSFVAPAMGASLSGMVTVQVAVTDAAALKWVTFGLDGTAISVSTGPTFEAMYDTRLLPNGPHTFTAMALDHNGAMGNATTEVMFNNPNAPTANSPVAGCSVAGGAAPWGLWGLAVLWARRRRRTEAPTA